MTAGSSGFLPTGGFRSGAVAGAGPVDGAGVYAIVVSGADGVGWVMVVSRDGAEVG